MEFWFERCEKHREFPISSLYFKMFSSRLLLGARGVQSETRTPTFGSSTFSVQLQLNAWHLDTRYRRNCFLSTMNDTGSTVFGQSFSRISIDSQLGNMALFDPDQSLNTIRFYSWSPSYNLAIATISTEPINAPQSLKDKCTCPGCTRFTDIFLSSSSISTKTDVLFPHSRVLYDP